MKLFEKFLGIFFFILGISIISVWGILIIVDKVPNIQEEFIDFIFHWSSELFLAILSIVIAISLFMKKKWTKKAIFFNLGMAISSTFNAVFYYIFGELDLTMVLFIGSFFIISLICLIKSFYFYKIDNIKNQKLYKFGLFNLGLLTYLLINIAGSFGQQGNWWSAFILLIFLIISCIIFFISLIRMKD